MDIDNQSDWGSYMCLLEDLPAYIKVDLELNTEAPNADYPILMILEIAVLESDENNFPVDSEFTLFQSLHQKLATQLANHDDLLYAGFVTHDCSHICYLYSKSEGQIAAEVTALITAVLPKHQYVTGQRKDPEWQAYLELLFPDEIGIQSIQNGRIIGYLAQQGDQLHEVRKVDHWLYFEEKSDLESFVKVYPELKLPLRIEEYFTTENEDWPYGLHLSHETALDHDAMNDLTLEIITAVEQFEGMYDGWETIMVPGVG